jgi:uncharacterized membrane protein YkvA (DUF1232 family)
MKIRRTLRRLRHEAKVYRALYKDNRTPRISKILLLVALGYLLLPFDIIPDFIPFAGQLDDVIIVPLLFYLATMFIPKEVVKENRLKAGGAEVKYRDVEEGQIVG